MAADDRAAPERLPFNPDRASWNRVSPSHEWENPTDRGFDATRRGPTSDLGADSVGRPGKTWTDRSFAGEPQTPRYRGLGPKGWRTDQRLTEEVSDALTRDPHVDASEITVTVEDGEVTLAGTVTERAQKRAAEDCVDRVHGVRDIHNRLRVVRPDAGLTSAHEAQETVLHGAGGPR